MTTTTAPTTTTTTPAYDRTTREDGVGGEYEDALFHRASLIVSTITGCIDAVRAIEAFIPVAMEDVLRQRRDRVLDKSGMVVKDGEDGVKYVNDGDDKGNGNGKMVHLFRLLNEWGLVKDVKRLYGDNSSCHPFTNSNNSPVTISATTAEEESDSNPMGTWTLERGTLSFPPVTIFLGTYLQNGGRTAKSSTTSPPLQNQPHPNQR